MPERLHPCELAGSKISGLNGEWLLFEDEFLSVRAGCVRHRVPSFGYVFEEHPFPGKLDMNRCIELGVPKGPLLGQLKNGSSVCLPDGRIVSPEDVVGPPIPGRKIGQAYTFTILPSFMFFDVCTLNVYDNFAQYNDFRCFVRSNSGRFL